MRICTAIDIEAPPDEVWAVLARLEDYESWNPFTVAVRGKLAEGEVVKLTVKLAGKTVKRRHQISALSAPSRICWTILSDQPWLIRGERCQTVEPIEGGSRYSNEEVVEGLVAPLVQLFYGSAIEAGLHALGQGLKAKVEQPSASPSTTPDSSP